MPIGAVSMPNKLAGAGDNVIGHPVVVEAGNVVLFSAESFTHFRYRSET